MASSRWMPSERPRWAMLTRPVTKSGSSRTIEANSSITMSSRGSGARRVLGPADRVVLDVLGAGLGQDVLAPLQLRAQRLQGPLDQVGVEVGDHADGVRQLDAVLERRAALVVDQHERHRVGLLATASEATMVCSSSDLPEPVVPAIRPCGPSRRRSMPNGPSKDSPTTAVVDWPPLRQRAAIAPAGGRLQVQHVQQPAGVRQAEPSSSPLMSRTARGAGQPAGTSPARPVGPGLADRPRPAC